MSDDDDEFDDFVLDDEAELQLLDIEDSQTNGR